MELYLNSLTNEVYTSKPGHSMTDTPAVPYNLRIALAYYLIRKYRLERIDGDDFTITVPESDRVVKKILAIKEVDPFLIDGQYMHLDEHGNEMSFTPNETHREFLDLTADEILATGKSSKLDVVLAVYNKTLQTIKYIKGGKTLTAQIRAYKVTITPIDTKRKTYFIADLTLKSEHINITMSKAVIKYKWLLGIDIALDQLIWQILDENYSRNNRVASAKLKTSINIDGEPLRLRKYRSPGIDEFIVHIRDAIIQEIPVSTISALQ